MIMVNRKVQLSHNGANIEQYGWNFSREKITVNLRWYKIILGSFVALLPQMAFSKCYMYFNLKHFIEKLKFTIALYKGAKISRHFKAKK